MELNKQKRNAGTAWLEKTNPLAGMSIREAQAIFDCARNGDTQRLHWMFQEIESANPVLMTCVERRVSALSGFRSSVVARPSADPSLAEEQQDAVSRFVDGIENFTDAIEHLDLAFFRGFSYIQPIYEPDGTVKRIELPDSWLFLTKDGELYFNPVCDGISSNAQLVTPNAKLVGVRRRRAIDYPALSIHIRQAVGDRDWGRFLERIALPKPAVIMAPGASDTEKDKYVEAAERVEDGQVSVWPSGSSLTDFMGGSRGQDPFSTFIRHQEEKIVLLSTGGTLTSLAQADTGSLAGGAQMQVWREIVRKDSVVVAQAVNKMVREYLSRVFPGRPVAAEFTFDTGDKLTAQESANVAATLKGAGWIVNQDELEKATGFTLEKDEAPAPQPGFAAPITNKAPDGRAQTPAAPQKKTAEDLLADALADAMSEELQKNKSPDASTQPDAVKNAITNPCPKCHRQMSADGTCTSCAKRASNHAAGKTAWAKAVADKADVLDAMERDSIGKIDFIWGHPGTPSKNYEDGEGVSHVLAKHKVDAGMITGVLAYGDILEDPAGDKYYAIKKRNLVVLRKREGRNSYVISGYVKNDPHKVKELRDRCKLIEEGE